VIGPNATDADALATAISVMGREEGIVLLKRLEDYRAVIVERGADEKIVVWCSEDLIPLISFDDRWKVQPKAF